jgi:hypothetical protein
MKLFIIFLSLTTLSIQAKESSLPGEYNLTKGSKNCPEGFLSLKNNRLMFGSRHAWMLGDNNKGESKDVADGGCTYLTNYEKSDTKIAINTTRSACPIKAENASINEELELKNNFLIYSFSKTSEGNSKSHFKCEYKKSVNK